MSYTHLYYCDHHDEWNRTPVEKVTPKTVVVRMLGRVIHLKKADLDSQGRAYSEKFYSGFYVKPVMHDDEAWTFTKADGWLFDAEGTKAKRKAEQDRRESDPVWLSARIASLDANLEGIRTGRITTGETGRTMLVEERERLAALLPEWLR